MSSDEYNAINERLDRIEQLAQIGAKPVLNIEEAVFFTGFAKPTLYSMTCGRRIPHYKKCGKLLFKKSELESWMTNHKVMTEEETNNAATTYCVLNRMK